MTVIDSVRPWPRHILSPEEWIAWSADPALALLGLWADTATAIALYFDAPANAARLGSIGIIDGKYPALSPHRLTAAWFERMVRDLWGHEAEGGRDLRPWLDHGRWAHHHPMALRPVPAGRAPEPPEFLPVEGEDINQIAVGPIHAGIIEPGHFRFNTSGETVARLEARLGYAHKGTLTLIRGKTSRAAARFAARLSGDSTVGHSIAFARAAEAALEVIPPERAVTFRAVMAEVERIANHLGDIGAICNDASFAFMLARFGLHRENVLRASAAAWGHRLMMDCVIPGGIAGDIAPAGPGAIRRALDEIEAELPSLIRVYEDYSSLIDRMVGTGIVGTPLATRCAAGGFAGRASGRNFDARLSPGYPPYPALDVRVPLRIEGDVDARVRIRLDEITESIRLVRLLLTDPPDGPVSVAMPMDSGEGVGWAEGFRGDIWHWLRLDGGLIAAGFLRDPSWMQWPLLEASTEGNIVADFPLCNKSFNCSYSGVDL